MEYIDEIDWEGNTIHTWPKSELKKKMFPHRVSLVIPKAHNNRFIISKRAKKQEPWPDTWVCAVGGKCVSGESFEECAKRKSLEEAGKELATELVGFFDYDGDLYKARYALFTTKEPISSSELKANHKEVQHFKEITLQTLEEEIKNNPKDFADTFVLAAKEFIRLMKH